MSATAPAPCVISAVEEVSYRAMSVLTTMPVSAGAPPAASMPATPRSAIVPPAHACWTWKLDRELGTRDAGLFQHPLHVRGDRVGMIDARLRAHGEVPHPADLEERAVLQQSVDRGGRQGGAVLPDLREAHCALARDAARPLQVPVQARVHADPLPDQRVQVDAWRRDVQPDVANADRPAIDGAHARPPRPGRVWRVELIFVTAHKVTRGEDKVQRGMCGPMTGPQAKEEISSTSRSRNRSIRPSGTTFRG